MTDGVSAVVKAPVGVGSKRCRSCHFWDRFGSGKAKWCAVWKGTVRPGDFCGNWTEARDGG